MSAFTKLFSKREKAGRTELSEYETYLIANNLLPRWDGEIPENLMDKNFLNAFRVFRERLISEKNT